MSDNFFNKTNQELGANNGANGSQNQKVKLRLRLKSGEEFEAEGSLEFVLAQKAEFLSKTGSQNAQYSTQITPSEQNQYQHRYQEPPQPSYAESAPKADENTNPAFNNEQPAQNTIQQPPALTSHIVTAEERLKEYNTIVPAIRWKRYQTERTRGEIAETAPSTATAKTPYQIDEKIWTKVAYIDGANIVLRRKIKDLKPNLAALITLAAAKMLAGITKMPALELSKSMRLSGYLKGDDRLDRILAPEIKAATLFFEGSKRNREYMISNTGTAKAYTAAEHFLRS